MGVPLPSLTVDPEGFFDRVVGRLTGGDIDLESEEFNRASPVGVRTASSHPTSCTRR